MKVGLFKKALKALFLLVSALVLIFLVAWTVRKIRVVKETFVLKTNHFQISYKGILKKEAEEISKALEENYNEIRAELDDPEHDVIDVFIHPNQKDFNSATGLKNSTANGTSRGPNAFHIMYQTWFNSFFPDDMVRVSVHEFTHCVQLNILVKDALSTKEKLTDVEFDRQFEQKFLEKYPQWFWEALSDYEAGSNGRAST